VKVVLRADVQGVGKRGDILEVADGFGRNYLLPTGRAIPASAGIASQAASMRRSRDLRDAKDREGAEAIARKLVPLVIKIPARSGTEGRLFGSVTNADVVAAVLDQSGISLDRRKLVSEEPIKTLGTHDLGVRLHSDVEFRLTIEVVPAN
jgi:large subunit ribosomal protein L9